MDELKRHLLKEKQHVQELEQQVKDLRSQVAALNTTIEGSRRRSLQRVGNLLYSDMGIQCDLNMYISEQNMLHKEKRIFSWGKCL